MSATSDNHFVLVCPDYSHTITGTEDADSLFGGEGDATIWGNNGNDYLSGGEGFNYLDGGEGNDTLLGCHYSSDILLGGDGDDSLYGNGEGNHLKGGAGKDTFVFHYDDESHATFIEDATSEDVLKLGEGIAAADLSAKLNGDDLVLSISKYGNITYNITLRYWNDSSFTNRLLHVTLHDGTIVSLQNLLNNSGGGADGNQDASGILTKPTWTTPASGKKGKTLTKAKRGKITGTKYNDTLKGGAKAELLAGGKGHDYMQGKGGHDTLKGGAGDDFLDGGAGKDTLKGGDGNDTLLGGKGKDKLSGGAGNDVFLFTTKAGKKNVDAITDFRHGEDAIALKRSIFSSLSAGQLGAENFCTVGKKNNKKIQGLDADDHIIYNTKTGALLYDRDGKGGAAAVQFAQLGTKKRHPTNISAEDFFVVE